MMEPTLNDQERNFVQGALGAGAQVLFSTIARFYTSRNGHWEYSQIMGALALLIENGNHFLRIVDMKQALYENFVYDAPVGFFHTFEMDSEVGGFSFASEEEAKTLLTFVNRSKNASISSQSSPDLRPTPHSPVLPHSNSSPAMQHSSLTNNRPSPGVPGRIVGTTATFKPVNVESEQPVYVSPKEQKRREKERRKQEKENKKTKKNGSFLEISGPTGFRHESSIGWDAQSGFQIRNIPPEWKEIFKQAGIRQKDLKDESTAKFVMDFMKNNTPPPPPPPGSPGGRTPPPPPPGGPGISGRTPPPPPPGGPGSFGRTPPPPPPGGPGASAKSPPPPPPPGAPPPPPPGAPPPPPPMGAPPPPPGDYGGDSSSSASYEPAYEPSYEPSEETHGSGGGGSGLLAALQGRQLKAVDRSPPRADPPPPSGLAATLAKAMEDRRGAIREDPSDGEDEDNWSDDDWD